MESRISFPIVESRFVVSVAELDVLEFDEFVVEFNTSDVEFEESKELRTEPSDEVEPMMSP
jgi:hypothetical protein